MPPWNVVCERRPAFCEQCRGVEQGFDDLAGHSLGASKRCAAFAQPGTHLAQILLFGEFVCQITNYRAHTIETVRLALAAREHMFAMAAAENIDFDLERRGILHFYADKRSFNRADAVNKLLREGGLDRRAVTEAEIRTIEPTLSGNYYGGFFTPSDSTGDIHKFTRGLADACARRGVRFVYDAKVSNLKRMPSGIALQWTPTSHVSVERRETFVDALVVCAGAASRNFAAMLGDRVNIYPVKGYSITVDLQSKCAQDAAPQVSILDDAAKIVTSRLGPLRFRVAGTAEFNGFNRDVRHDRIEPLVRWTRTHFPRVETDRVQGWSGLRPMMPSMLPRVGQGRDQRVFYNTGHGHLGWTLSAATAHVVCELMLKSISSRCDAPRTFAASAGHPQHPAA